MRDRKRSNILVVLLVAASSFLLEGRLSEATGLRFNLILSALITLAFFTDVFGIAFASLLAAFAVNWKPAPSPEVALIVLIPFAVFFGRRFMPGKPWLGNLVFLAAGFLIFYGVSDFHAVRSAAGVLALDAAAGTAFGALLFKLIEFAHVPGVS